MGAVPADAQTALSHITSLFKQDLIPEAFEALRNFGTVHTENDYPEYSPNIPEIKELRRDVESANDALALLADFDSWQLVREEDDIAIFAKGAENEFYVRSEMLMRHSPFSLLAVFSEVDLLPNWCGLGRIEVIQDANEVARPSLFRRVNHFTMKLPWPLSNRDMLVSCIGVPMPQNKSVLLTIKDVDGSASYLGTPMPAPVAGVVRMAVHQCCINIMQLDDGQTQVSFLVRSDPKIALLPAAVKNWGAKQAAFLFMRAIREQCARFSGSEYEKRVKNNPQYYDKLRELATRYHFENVE